MQSVVLYQNKCSFVFLFIRRHFFFFKQHLKNCFATFYKNCYQYRERKFICGQIKNQIESQRLLAQRPFFSLFSIKQCKKLKEIEKYINHRFIIHIKWYVNICFNSILTTLIRSLLKPLSRRHLKEICFFVIQIFA